MARQTIGIIGGGPAGLMAAEALSLSGHSVTVYDAMPTVGRKFLLAGKSGLNITHSEDYSRFVGRFGMASGQLRNALDGFTPDDIRAWAQGLGTETFVGSSGRVFPRAMKASPLLRAWLARLEAQGVTLMKRHRWIGFSDDVCRFETSEGPSTLRFDAVLLALGGASWPKLGSTGSWVPWLREVGVDVAEFRPANCGFDVSWREAFSDRFAGDAVKSVTATSIAGTIPGEFVITRHGIEGSLVYAHAAGLRDSLDTGQATFLTVDLTPGRSLERLTLDLARHEGKASLSNRLRKAAGLEGVKAGLLLEFADRSVINEPSALARAIKALDIPIVRPRPIDEAISVAGGVKWSGIDSTYMLKNRPGTFVAGEMLDWEAPTGGYLLTACLATGRAAARGIDGWLNR